MVPSKPRQLCRGLTCIAHSTKHQGLELSSYHLRPSLSDPQAKHVMFPSSYALLIPGWSFEATKGPVCSSLVSCGLDKLQCGSGGCGRARASVTWGGMCELVLIDMNCVL